MKARAIDRKPTLISEMQLTRIAIPNATIGQQIVEAWHAFELLQPVDHREPAIVADHNNHLVTTQNCRVDVRVHHQIGAVADHHDRRAAESAGPGIGHRMAPTGRDLVAHAREAELKVKGVRRLDAPAFCHFARQPAGG